MAKKIQSNENVILYTILGLIGITVVGAIAFVFSSASGTVTTDDRMVYLGRVDSYVKGNVDSDIIVTEFSDFQCPACQRFFGELKQLSETYSDDIKFIYKYFPLTNIHPNAYLASEASEAAGDEGKFWEMHDLLFENQIDWSNLSGDELEEKFVEYATTAGVEDLENFRADLNGLVHKEKIDRDMEDARALEVNATPTIYLNGEQVSNPTF